MGCSPRPPAQLSRPARVGRAERTKNGQSSRADGGSTGPNALDRENWDAQTCMRSGQISRGRLSVPRLWQCHQNRWFARASDAAPWWLGLPTLAGSPRLPWSGGLRHSSSQLTRQAGRSDLCSPHQHGSAGHSACFVIRVTQRCRTSQVCRKMARDAGLVALATAQVPSDLPIMSIASIICVCGYAVWVHICQISRKWPKRPTRTPALKWSCLKPFVCNCVLASDVLSTRTG
jgi:hypothetical protein